MSEDISAGSGEVGSHRWSIRAFLTLATIRIATVAMSFARVRALVESGSRGTGCRHRPSPDEIALSVMRASTFAPGLQNCLCRALATKRILNRFNYESELKIGARKTDDRGFHAHAWVESDGKVLIGDLPELNQFAVMSGTGAARGVSNESSR